MLCVSAGRATTPFGVSPERDTARAHADSRARTCWRRVDAALLNGHFATRGFYLVACGPSRHRAWVVGCVLKDDSVAPFRSVLGCFWGAVWGLLGASWQPLEASRGLLGPSWGARARTVRSGRASGLLLGAVMEAFWAVLEASRIVFGLWGHWGCRVAGATWLCDRGEREGGGAGGG